MNEERIIELEMKVSHQEVLLEQLNDVVTQQQENLDLLEAKVKSLFKRFQENLDNSETRNEKPPHY